jgi:hypothetical protein
MIILADATNPSSVYNSFSGHAKIFPHRTRTHMGKNKALRKAENRIVQQEASLETYLEYSKRLDVLQEQSAKLASRIASTQRTQRTAMLGLKYIKDSAKDSDNYYTQLGRCFLLDSRKQIMNDMESRVNVCGADLPRLQAAMDQFEKLKKEQLEQITELKQQ